MSDNQPTGWTRLTLGDLGTFSTSSVDKGVAATETSVSLVNYMDVYRNRFIDRSLKLMQVTASLSEIERSQVETGDLLFTPSSETPDDIGHSAVVAEALPLTLHSYHTVRLRPDGSHELNLRFKGRVANSRNVLNFFAERATGSTRFTLSLGDFKAAPVLIPPLPEQRRIAEILDTVDEAIRKTEEIIAKLNHIKQGLLHDLLTRGIDENGKLRDPERHPEQFKDSPLGRIPRAWEVVDVRSVTAFITDYRGKTPPYASEGIPAISAENIGGGKIRSITKFVTTETYLRWTTRGFPEAGDTLFTTEAPVAEVARLPGDRVYLLTRRLIGLRPSPSIVKAFFYWFMYRQSSRGAWVRFTHGSTVPRVLKPDILSAPFPLLSIGEQEAITERLDCIQDRLDLEVTQQSKLRLLKQGLMDDLLTGRVRVRVPDEAA